MPTELAGKKPLQAGRAYCSLDTISELDYIQVLRRETYNSEYQPWRNSPLKKLDGLRRRTAMLSP